MLGLGGWPRLGKGKIGKVLGWVCAWPKVRGKCKMCVYVSLIQRHCVCMCYMCMCSSDDSVHNGACMIVLMVCPQCVHKNMQPLRIHMHVPVVGTSCSCFGSEVDEDQVILPYVPVKQF